MNLEHLASVSKGWNVCTAFTFAPLSESRQSITFAHCFKAWWKYKYHVLCYSIFLKEDVAATGQVKIGKSRGCLSAAFGIANGFLPERVFRNP